MLTTFAPAENSTFVLNGWFMHTQSHIYIYIRVVRRALNLLRASFSPIFQYFSAVNVTRVSFSPVFQYFATYVCIGHAPRNCVVGH